MATKQTKPVSAVRVKRDPPKWPVNPQPILCRVCKVFTTCRRIDLGDGKPTPVCTHCFVSGKWKELKPDYSPPPPIAEEVKDEPDEGESP